MNHGNARNVTVMLFAVFLLLMVHAPVAGIGTGASLPAQNQVNNDDELVYLAPSGVIKVFDPIVATGEREVKWQSPSGGWSHIALGDFNADGDAEIVAISRSGTNRLAIFDPVAEGLDPGDADGVINGIPWKLLHERPLTGVPFLVATGNFDLESPADEIVYYDRLPSDDVVQPDDPFRFVFIAAEGSPPNG